MPEAANSLPILSREFSDRCAQVRTERMHPAEVPYTFCSGYYGERVAVDPVGLTGSEVFMAARIQDMLPNATPDAPAVGWDIGGGAGCTWLKLAGQFSGEIDEGRLVLAVSNIRDDPDDFIRQYQLRKQNRIATAGLRQLLEDQGSRVQYLHASLSADHLPRILLRHGQQMVPWGGIGLAHEQFSMSTWSKIPELHIARLGQLVTPRGLYMGRNQVDALIRMHEQADMELHPYAKQVYAGQQALQQQGMRRVRPTAGYLDSYTMFFGREAQIPPSVYE